jgi:2,4-dienoyl-CoA reductase-like NADH-dependent reductase (Old Yellow Enzyme family)/thioredoxin reductase
MIHSKFPNIFKPLQIRNMVMPNRIAISGHHAGWWVDQGMPSEEFAAYIEERAKGGVGLFVIGCTSPKPGSGWLENLSDDVIPRYQKCVEAGHRHGTPIIAQLCHPGFAPLPNAPLVLPRPTAEPIQPQYRGRNVKHEMSIDEIQDMVASFGLAAARCAAGGVDGVELHSHEWFLHSQMINPYWNHRTDEYGGSLENRMRFMVETLQAMRVAVGPDKVVGVRLKADDMEQRGNEPRDYAEIIRRLEADHLVDYVLLTGGDARLHHGPMARPESEWVPLVKTIRAGTKLPVLHAGRIMTAEDAEEALASGAMDAVVMTKAHIAEPHFVKKVFEGRLEDIRYCTRCLQGCHHAMHRMTCVYNPLTSREKEWSDQPSLALKKRVVIVGAGPAGMEAAVNASARGHEVIVLERGEEIGGQVVLGSQSPTRGPWLRIAEFYRRQAAKGEFSVKLGVDATAETVLALRPDFVIVATGSKPSRLTAGMAHTAVTVHEALSGLIDHSKRVVILDREGFMRPIVVADRLASLGAEVHFVTPFTTIWPQVEHWTGDEFLRRFLDQGVKFYPGSDIGQWTSAGDVVIRDVQRGSEIVLDSVDNLVGAIGSNSENWLADELRGKVDLRVIGDANVPGTVENATYQGALIGREL